MVCRPDGGEKRTAEVHPPELGEGGPLQALREPVGSGMERRCGSAGQSPDAGGSGEPGYDRQAARKSKNAAGSELPRHWVSAQSVNVPRVSWARRWRHVPDSMSIRTAVCASG